MPQGLPSGWYATFDGFSVAQVAPDRWVYGRVDRFRGIVPTDVLVGSVVPTEIPELARVATAYEGEAFFTQPEFFKILEARYDNMAVLDDPLARTVVAWRTGSPELKVWVADRWLRVMPFRGQRTSDALAQRIPYIARLLREKNFTWGIHGVEELANAARSLGFYWRGAIPFAAMAGHRDGADWDGRTASINIEIDRGPSGQEPSIPDPAPSPGDGWDIGGGGGNAPSNGGGWDTPSSGPSSSSPSSGGQPGGGWNR